MPENKHTRLDTVQLYCHLHTLQLSDTIKLPLKSRTVWLFLTNLWENPMLTFTLPEADVVPIQLCAEESVYLYLLCRERKQNEYDIECNCVMKCIFAMVI